MPASCTHVCIKIKNYKHRLLNVNVVCVCDSERHNSLISLGSVIFERF